MSEHSQTSPSREAAINCLDDVAMALKHAERQILDYPQRECPQAPYNLISQSIKTSLSLAYAMKEVLRGRL